MRGASRVLIREGVVLSDYMVDADFFGKAPIVTSANPAESQGMFQPCWCPFVPFVSPTIYRKVLDWFRFGCKSSLATPA